MTVQILDWLPLSALDDPRIEKKVLEVIPRWNARWLDHAKGYALKTFATRSPNEKSSLSTLEWRDSGFGLVIAWSAKSTAILAQHVVDASKLAAQCDGPDKALLDALAWEILCDLASAVARALDIAPITNAAVNPFASSGGIEVTLSSQCGDLPDIGLALPAHLVAGARKALLKAPIQEKRVGGSLSEAFDEEQLDVTAKLGTALLTGADLCNLEIGDVIILDTALSGTLALQSNANRGDVCQAHLSQAKGSIEILAAEA